MPQACVVLIEFLPTWQGIALGNLRRITWAGASECNVRANVKAKTQRKRPLYCLKENQTSLGKNDVDWYRQVVPRMRRQLLAAVLLARKGKHGAARTNKKKATDTVHGTNGEFFESHFLVARTRKLTSSGAPGLLAAVHALRDSGVLYREW